MHARVCACICARERVCVCAHACLHACVSVGVRLFVRERAHTCAFVRACMFTFE